MHTCVYRSSTHTHTRRRSFVPFAETHGHTGSHTRAKGRGARCRARCTTMSADRLRLRRYCGASPSPPPFAGITVFAGVPRSEEQGPSAISVPVLKEPSGSNSQTRRRTVAATVAASAQLSPHGMVKRVARAHWCERISHTVLRGNSLGRTRERSRA